LARFLAPVASLSPYRLAISVLMQKMALPNLILCFSMSARYMSLVTEVQGEKIANLACQATKKLPKTTQK
jgi:hypothetical protein